MGLVDFLRRRVGRSRRTPGYGEQYCPACHGTGYVVRNMIGGRRTIGGPVSKTPCEQCGGSGIVATAEVS